MKDVAPSVLRWAVNPCCVKKVEKQTKDVVREDGYGTVYLFSMIKQKSNRIKMSTVITHDDKLLTVDTSYNVSSTSNIMVVIFFVIVDR